MTSVKAGQEMHPTFANPFAYVLGSHGSHEVEPLNDEKRPGGQGRHAAPSEIEYEPGGHGRNANVLRVTWIQGVDIGDIGEK